MLKNNNEYNVSKSTVVCGIIVVCMMLFVLFTSNDSDNKSEENTSVDNSKIIELFDQITNNYRMDITEEYNSNENKYIYHIGNDLEVYETDSIDYIYLIYNNVVYKMDSNNRKLTKIDEIPTIINNPYINYDFIKNVIKKCDFKYVSSKEVSCTLLVTDYINEYNNYYNETINNASSKTMNINISYSSAINKIDIDYTNVSKAITGSDDILKYSLKLSSIETNDFSEINDYLKNELN